MESEAGSVGNAVSVLYNRGQNPLSHFLESRLTSNRVLPEGGGAAELKMCTFVHPASLILLRHAMWSNFLILEAAL